MKKHKEKKKFKRGAVVVFEPENFNPKFWAGLSEADKKKYYGPLGYGAKKRKLFVFITEIRNAPGHCVLISLDNQKIETMRHTSDFREVTEEEM